MTNDLDICYSRTHENRGRIVRALAELYPRLRDFPDGLPLIWDENTLRKGMLFTLHTDWGIVDLLGEVAGVDGYDEAVARSVRVFAFERDVWTLDLPAPILAKQAAGREKDLRILPELEALLEARDSEE